MINKKRFIKKRRKQKTLCLVNYIKLFHRSLWYNLEQQALTYSLNDNIVCNVFFIHVHMCVCLLFFFSGAFASHTCLLFTYVFANFFSLVFAAKSKPIYLIEQMHKCIFVAIIRSSVMAKQMLHHPTWWRLIPFETFIGDVCCRMMMVSGQIHILRRTYKIFYLLAIHIMCTHVLYIYMFMLLLN